ncbi:hypothetical protein [Polyangium mundeleinium]|uniref:Lipoprotein n=1 Tax=Polyangium mundeleinium TaxID=2995306 RepID=A0ABT5EWY0_9BACT|nr:hypothetical protein [Polyangium mundeleinium]MDC0746316.1 hypothetical protein [Polyangium mundeleinium]
MTYLAERSVLLSLALALGGLGCVGLEAGIDYPSDLPSPDEHVATPEGEADPSISLNGFVIKDEVCKEVDTRPVTQRLGPEDFARFLETQGLKIEPQKARDNLYWFDFPTGEKKEGEPQQFLRLRLAVLDDHFAATRDLQESLLDHGPGWWGVRRSNLAVLAPKTGLSESVAFALKHKLVCWGMFAYSGTDDVYGVPGPYTEL